MARASEMRAGETAAYRACLHRHLTNRDVREVEFFVNARRFHVLTRTLGPHLQGADVLNVASGPFAFEFFVAPDVHAIDSIDVDAALPGLHAELRSAGLIGQSTFTLADVMQYEPRRQYGIIIINDLFYTKYVDFHAVLSKYVEYLEPGGRIYFDILDERAGPIWAAFNKDAQYRRYDIRNVRETLASSGLTIEAAIPSMGIKGGLDGLARRLMWRLTSIANNVIFLARRAAPLFAFAVGAPELVPQ